MPQPADDHIGLALAHVSAALEGFERTAADAYAEAAFNARLTSYGNHCAKRALLQRISADLKLLHRSVSAPGLLVPD
jgi:DNA-binding LytR/AlgR family response regulator